MENNTSIANFFKEAFNVKWENMEVGETIDVSNYERYVKSFNNDTQKNEFNKVTKIIRKPDSPEYVVNIEDKGFSCSSDHKVACKFNKDKKDFTYQPVSILIGKKVFGLSSDGKWRRLSIKKTGNVIPILDFEVEKTHNYYSEELLSHNTIFGNPETVSGGKALAFWTSIRLDIRRTDYIKKGEEITGIKTRLKGTKNKTAPPFRKAEIEIIFGDGIQYEQEYVDHAVQYGFIEKSASWFNLYDSNGKHLERIQGKEKVINYLKENPEYFEFLKEKVNKALYGSEESEEGVVTEDEGKKETETNEDNTD